MTHILNTGRENLRVHVWCQFGDSRPNLWQVIARTSWTSYNYESKWPKWHWRSDLYSQCQLRVTHAAHLVMPAQICDELTCRQGKVYRQADRKTNRRMDRCHTHMRARITTLRPELNRIIENHTSNNADPPIELWDKVNRIMEINKSIMEIRNSFMEIYRYV